MDSVYRVAIYGLYDPRTDDLRYVGKSTNPACRYAHHCMPSAGRNNPHLGHWIAQLRTLGLRPTMRVLEYATDAGWPARERDQIARAKDEGAPIVNVLPGGEGFTDGHRHRPEVREKISAAQRGKSVSDVTRRRIAEGRRSWWASLSDADRMARMAKVTRAAAMVNGDPERARQSYERRGLAQRGKSVSAETRAKLSAANRGHVRTAEQRLRQSSTATGKKHSAATKALIASITQGRKHAPEAVRRMAEARRGMGASPEAREHMRQAHIGKTIPPEVRAKMADAQRLRREREKQCGDNEQQTAG
jgi:hypothetical protein